MESFIFSISALIFHYSGNGKKNSFLGVFFGFFYPNSWNLICKPIDGIVLTALQNPAMGAQLLCKGPITLRSSEMLVHLWRQRCHQPRCFSLPVVEVLVPVNLYGCNMYLMIRGLSCYNRLLAGECDSRWLSSNRAADWYESAHEYLLVQTLLFFFSFLKKNNLELCLLWLTSLQAAES